MSKSTLIPDHQTLSDYIDGQLSAEERAEVEAAAAKDPAVAQELAALSKLNEEIGSLGRETLDEPVPERLRAVMRPDPTKAPQSPLLFVVLWRSAALGLAVFVGFIAGYMTNDTSEPDFSSLIEPFVEQAVLSHKLFKSNTYSSPDDRIVISPETELATTSLHAPMRVPVSLGPGLQPVSLRTRTGTAGSAVQVAYLDPENKLTSLLVREMSDQGEMPADFATRDEYQVLFWIDGPLIYALVGETDEAALRSMAQSVYSSNAIGGVWLRDQGEVLQPVSNQ